MKPRISDTIQTIQTSITPQALQRHHVLIWPDGFVDEIIDVVAKRTSPHGYQPVQTITDFGQIVTRFAGKSGNLELAPRRLTYGGNGPRLAGAISAFGVPTTLIGCLGDPPDTIHPVFSPLRERCNLISINPPAHTDALEFSDGKLMLGKHAALHTVTWDQILRWIPLPKLCDLIASATMFVQVNWVMLPHMGTIWQHLLDEVLPSLGSRAGRRQMFIDLCDPTKRGVDELRSALRQITAFQDYFAVTLGLNENEAVQVTNALNLDVPPGALTTKTAAAIRDALNIQGTAIHCTKHAVASVQHNGAAHATEVTGFYTDTPQVLTGGGDHFNAGFCLGTLLGWPLSACLLFATATSGAYVRLGHSPSISTILALITQIYD